MAQVGDGVVLVNGLGVSFGGAQTWLSGWIGTGRRGSGTGRRATEWWLLFWQRVGTGWMGVGAGRRGFTTGRRVSEVCRTEVVVDWWLWVDGGREICRTERKNLRIEK